MIYYIDRMSGAPDADGLSPERARRDYRDLTVRPGDKVLFRRGTYMRETLAVTGGEAGAPVTYGAWGEGNNPVFCGSVDVSDPSLWEAAGENVWRLRTELSSEACNFIYDGGRVGGALAWEKRDLAHQGDWHDTAIGSTEQHRPLEEAREVLLYSVGNPGEHYRHIECAVRGERRMAPCLSHVIYEDLAFENSGVHGIAGTAVDVTVRRCSFCFIGGCVWNRQLKIRFGNGIEFWNTADDMLVEDCFFNNVYDSCVTHQGAGPACRPANNLHYRRNLFMNYGMAAYEARDHMTVASSFTDNICVRAIGGFSPMGDITPRRSEIWPQPMGHHLFLWRIPAAAEGGSLEIARNIFWDAPEGAAVYSIISPAAEAQMSLHDNVYWTSNEKLLNRIGGRSYAPADFARYQEQTGQDAGSRYEKMDLAALLDFWFARAGIPRAGVTETMEGRPPRIGFTGGTAKDPISYRAGEEAVFDVRLTKDGGDTVPAPRFRWTLRADGGASLSGETDGASGHAVIRAVLPAAGFVRLTVTACAADGTPLPYAEPFEGGAGADVRLIRQAGEEPADFDAFWTDTVRAELDPVAPVFTMKREFACGDPADQVFDVRVAAPGGADASGYLRIPRGAAAGSLPIRVIFRGYGVSSADVPPKAEAISLSLNQMGTENGHPQSYYDALRAEKYENFGFGAAENASPATCELKYLLLRAVQAVRALKTMPEWNGRDVILTGGSMGAFQAVFAAAMEPGATNLELFIPWMCDLAGAGAGRLRGWRPDGAAMPYYDTVSFARRVTAPVTITAGLGDDVCPASGIAALYNAFTSRKSLCLIQDRTHAAAGVGASGTCLADL